MAHRGIHIGAGHDQHRNGLRAIRKMSRPVCRHVQQRARNLMRINNPNGGQRRRVTQLSAQRCGVTLLDRGDHRDGAWVRGWQGVQVVQTELREWRALRQNKQARPQPNRSEVSAQTLWCKVLDSFVLALYRVSMAAPLRQPPADPPALHDRAIQDLSFIRRTMEGAASFTDVPGWGLVVVGLSAIAAAAVASAQVSAGRWLTVWLVEAILGATIGGLATWRKMRRRPRAIGAPVFSAPARKFLFGFWPAMLAGAVLTFSLIDMTGIWSADSTVPRVLPGLWLLLYGVAITTAGAFSVRAVPLMGLGLMSIGIVALVVPRVSADLLLASGFGLWQIAFGAWIARRHGG